MRKRLCLYSPSLARSCQSELDSRHLAKSALEARLGTFIPAEYQQQGREEQGYEKKPRFARVDTSRLWEEYQAQRDLHKTQVTEEDRAYNESRFSEVRDAIFANPYQKVWGGEGEPALPRLNLLTVSVNLGTLFDRMTDLQ